MFTWLGGLILGLILGGIGMALIFNNNKKKMSKLIDEAEELKDQLFKAKKPLKTYAKNPQSKVKD